MESYPKFEGRGESDQEMIDDLKKGFVNLCEKLKEQIESGEYDAIVSDDAGGRIPTLLFREIFRLVNPEHSVKTLFVASGQFHLPKNKHDEETLTSYLKKGIGDSKKVLLVTQYIHTGKSLNRLVGFLRKINVDKVDVSTIGIDKESFSVKGASSTLGCDGFFVGGDHENPFIFREKHNVLSGISKTKKYDPMPIRLDKAIESGERKRTEFMTIEEQDELFCIDEEDTFSEISLKQKGWTKVFKELDSVPLSEEEKSAIQENINKTRIHIKELAKSIVTEVWGI